MADAELAALETSLGCTIERTVIERITVVGPMAESKAVMARLHDAGWDLVRTGPYTDRDIYPRCNMERFLFIGEREIEGD